MNIPFWKMHGAANDFILVDDREQTFPADNRDWVASVAARRTGVGCEGVILIQPSDQADFRMRFFNPDGGEVEMCGNGARCVARLAHHIGVAPEHMSIDTVAGVLRAEVTGNDVLLHMTPPHGLELGLSLNVAGETRICHTVNTGVPHVVMTVEDIETADVQTLGATLRYHEAFAPAGTNANFIELAGPDHVRVRTYERGVEAETLACGTGMVAAGIVAGLTGMANAPVNITPASGDRLVVDYDREGDGVANVTLRGPAEFVYEGVLVYPG